MDWKAEYATGIGNIDHQHAHVVQLITQYEAMSETEMSAHAVHPLILRTRRFMEFHFSVEEALMRLLPYPDCEAHRAEHQIELKHIADIERGVLNGVIRRSLAARMRDCLFGHIIAGDQRFAQYARGLFRGRPAGPKRIRPYPAARLL
jgi:hemerythrin-like metal-binding protein